MVCNIYHKHVKFYFSPRYHYSTHQLVTMEIGWLLALRLESSYATMRNLTYVSGFLHRLTSFSFCFVIKVGIFAILPLY